MAGTATRQMPVVDALLGGECLTTAALAEITGLEGRHVADACCKLVSRGWIIRRERGCFVLSPEGRRAVEAGETISSGPTGPLTQAKPRRPKRRTVRDKMWSAMLTLRKFRIADLEMMASASHANSLRYALALEKTGYLTRLRSEPGIAETSNGFVRWLLIRPSGGLAPVYRAERFEVYDPNTDQTYPIGRSS